MRSTTIPLIAPVLLGLLGAGCASTPAPEIEYNAGLELRDTKELWGSFAWIVADRPGGEAATTGGERDPGLQRSSRAHTS